MVEVGDHSQNSQFARSPPNHFLRFNIPKPLGSQSKVLFELYQKHFPYLPPDGRWIHFLESELDPALPEVVMQRNPLWPRLEFSTIDTNSDTTQFSPLTPLQRFSPDKGIGQSQLLPKAA